jgi:hypothetical protein
MRKRSGFNRIAGAALAALLTVLVLAEATLAVCPALHERLHPHGAAGHHSCLVCAFAKGQVGTGDAVPVVALLSLSFLYGVWRVPVAPLLSVSYCLSPSRAPPRF